MRLTFPNSLRCIFSLLTLSLLLGLTGCRDVNPISNDKSEQNSPNKTVLLSILARNKAHVLPKYLEKIDQLDYDKKLITVYINTNNNIDATPEILEQWVEKNGDQYANVIVEKYDIKTDLEVNPHDWSYKRCYVLGRIRDRSLQKALENNVDYYFVADCDNFIEPHTLKTLVNKDKPIIAPMLRAIPQEGDTYSNYYTAVNQDGYFEDDGEYLNILERNKKGTFEVPLVHCTYLINAKEIENLSYTDDSGQHEYVIFARSARENGVPQFVCNESNFGVLLHPDEQITLEEEAELVKNLKL